MAVVQPSDVAASLGRPISDANEHQQISTWIGDAEMLVRVRLGDLSLLDRGALAYVVREAVANRARNPEGYQSETIDDYTYRMPTESRSITILDDWWALLSPPDSAGAFTIRPGGVPL